MLHLGGGNYHGRFGSLFWHGHGQSAGRGLSDVCAAECNGAGHHRLGEEYVGWHCDDGTAGLAGGY